jgi:hypothetical protein
MNVEPVGAIHTDFGKWLERRRARLEAQLAALETERLEDLVALLAHEDDDRPPSPRTSQERAEYLKVLREHERLAQRMAVLRGRLLQELKELDRERIQPSTLDRYRSIGHRFDGYL